MALLDTLSAQQQLELTYVGYFNRAADGAGFLFWENQYATAKGSPSTIINNIANSFAPQAETLALYPFLSNTTPLSPTDPVAQNAVNGLVSSIYNNLFGRAADAAGLAYWTNQILTGAVGLGQAILTIANGAAAGSADYQLLQNKVVAALNFTTVTSAAGIGLTTPTPASFITEAKFDLTLVTNAATGGTTAAMNEATNFVASGGGVTGTIFTLTSGVDAPGTGAFATSNITGSNNTVVGTVNGTTNTFNPGDQIGASASAAGNKLILADQTTTGTANVTGIAAATVSNLSLTVNSAEAVTVNTVSGATTFSNVPTLTVNSAAAGANADTITAAGTTAVVVTDTATAAASITGVGLTINGGSTVTLTETNTTTTGAALLSNVSIGQTTAPTGAVTATVTETVSTAASAPANITVKAGGPVTINSTVNDGTAAGLGAAVGAGTQTAGDAGTISVTGAVGAVVVNDALNIASTTTITSNADAVKVTGGSTVTVNETVSATQSATTVSSIAEGAVAVTGDATTTSVTVNQAAVATGSIVKAAAAAVAPVNELKAVAAGPGTVGVTAVTQVTAVPAVKAVATGTPTVTADGVVTIVDANGASGTATNTIASVTLNSYGATSSIQSSALSNLSLSGTGGSLTITNSNTAAGTAKASTLNLTVNGLSTGTGTSDAITDTNNEIATLNITTGATASSIVGAAALSTTAFTDTGLTTVNVSGSSVLTVGAWGTAPKNINVTGAAGYTGLIDDTATIFNASGSTGKDMIGISAVATKAITGGSGTTDEIVINATAIADTATSAANLAKFNTNVTGFEILGVTSAVTGQTFDVSKLTATFSGIDILNNAAWGGTAANSFTFTNVAAGTALTLNGAATSVSYATSDTNGANDSLVFTDNAAGTLTGLVLADANGVGIGNLTVASAGTGANTIGTLTDTALASLTLTGAQALTVGTFTSDLATSLTITDNSTYVPASVAQATAGYAPTINGALTISTLTDNNLGNLVFAGSDVTVVTALNDTAANITISSTDSAPVQIGTLTGTALGHLTLTGTGSIDIGVLSETAANVTIANSGTGTVTVADAAATGFVDAALTSLTLSGNVAFGTDSTTAATAFGAATGITVAAGTDNAHISISLTAAGGGATNTITLGNGNDTIHDNTAIGTVSVTVGTGYDLIDVSHATAGTFSSTVAVGSHTSTATLYDQVNVSAISAAVAAPNTVLTGLVANDHIVTTDGAIAAVATLTSGQQTQASAYATLGAAVAYVDGLLAAHNAASFAWNGNTYVIENSTAGVGSGTLAVADTLVEIVGTHTLASSLSTGHLVLAS